MQAILGGPPGDYASVRTVSANRPYKYVVHMAAAAPLVAVTGGTTPA
jgi:hypothetical protein